MIARSAGGTQACAGNGFADRATSSTAREANQVNNGLAHCDLATGAFSNHRQTSQTSDRVRSGGSGIQ